MHGAAANRTATVVGAELQWVGAVADTLVGPIELVLVQFIGREIFERSPPWTSIETNDGKAGLGEPAG
jgi:hypothetical protein